MEILFEGRVRVDYHQCYLESGDVLADYTGAFEGQANTLLGAGIVGALTLSTGTALGDVGLRIVLWDVEPPAADPAWEEVVEVSFVPQGSEIGLRDPMGGGSGSFEMPLAEYRVRLCARGYEESWDFQVGPEEPLVDTYELHFWPAPLAPDEVLRLTSRHTVAMHRALDPALVREDRIASWDGNPPSDELLDDPMVEWFVRLDRDLAEEMLAAGPHVQRQLTYWAADRGCLEAGIAEIGWVAAGLRAMWSDERLPVPFSEPGRMYQQLDDDPGNPRRRRDGDGDEMGGSALFSLLGALDANPLHTAMHTVSSLGNVLGAEHADEVRRWAREELRRLVAEHGPDPLPDSRPAEAFGWDDPVQEFTEAGPDSGWFAPGTLLTADDPAAQYLDPRPVAEQIADLADEAPDVLERVATLAPEELRDVAFDLARQICSLSGLNELTWVNDAFLSYGQSSAPEPWSNGTEGVWLMSNPRVHERTTLHGGLPVPVWPFALRAVRNSLSDDPRVAALLAVHAGIRVGGDHRAEEFLSYVRYRLQR